MRWMTKSTLIITEATKSTDNMKEEFIQDIICNVLANEKLVKIIYKALNEFIPNYEKLNPDYACPTEKGEHAFKSEQGMVRFFIENKGITQAFYWNKYEDNPDGIMLGASITTDDKLILSLTFNGTKETEAYYFLRLKSFLNSDVGVISYIDPPEYENGQDFMNRYGN
jgi:hypothetical protein